MSTVYKIIDQKNFFGDKFMQIGNIKLKNKFFLAPMAGLTNLPFRILCRENGCGLAYTEMISAKGIFYDNQKTLELLETNRLDRPLSVQLFGHEPQIFYDAIKKIDSNNFDLIDINFGCPAKKIIRNGEGSALLENQKLISEIIKACVSATKKPVTAKIRQGFMIRDNKKIIETAKIIEQAGASAICIHGRLAKDFYSGEADWNIIHEIKKNIHIPVIGNGDIKTCFDAKKIFESTNCDAIMIGRASLGNPIIFKQIDQFLNLNQKNILPDLTPKERINLALRHLEILNSVKNKNFFEMRSHLFFYIKNFSDASKIRSEINKCTSHDDFFYLLKALTEKL